MRESITAMLVENQRDSFGALRSGLEKLSVTTFAAKNCAEAHWRYGQILRRIWCSPESSSPTAIGPTF